MNHVFDRAEVRLLELPLTEPFVASHGTTHTRTLAVVRISQGQQVGWGECSALPAATYTSESARGAFTALAEQHLPEALSRAPEPEMSGNQDPTHNLALDQPMARAAIEMAMLDLHLKAAGHSLADHLGVQLRSVPAGVSLGLDQVKATAAKVARFADDGFGRVKLKIQPGHDVRLLETVRAQADNITIQIDANGSYRNEHVEHLASLAHRFGVEAIEQPFAPDDINSATKLVGLVGPSNIHVVADEAAMTIDDVERLDRSSSLTAVSIKPPRFGGIRAAVLAHNLCATRGIAATAGGMLESGLGRHALAAIAGLPHFSIVGDVSPARRWIRTDPWPDLQFSNGRIAVPIGPGIAPPPDETVLDLLTVEREVIT